MSHFLCIIQKKKKKKKTRLGPSFINFSPLHTQSHVTHVSQGRDVNYTETMSARGPRLQPSLRKTSENTLVISAN